MHTGMLWFDNSKDALSVKIGKAIDYYFKKYGVKPDLCVVNPKMLQSESVGTIKVKGYRYILPGHIWIGIEDKEKGGDNGKEETT